MPRVTFNEHYRRHHELKRVWETVFLELEPLEQWNLHDWYRPSETLTKEELHTHWREPRRARSSLPQQAGRAYAKLQPYLLIEQPSGTPRLGWQQATSGKNAKVVVKSLVHPKLDVDGFVDLVMMLGRQLQEEAEGEANLEHTNMHKQQND